MSRRKTSDPFWWSLFSVGGVVAAFLVPVHLFLHGLAIPLGWVSLSHAQLFALLQQPVIKFYLLVLIALPLYHSAHRFRFVLEDIGLHGLRTPVALLSYGGALIGTAITLWVLWQI